MILVTPGPEHLASYVDALRRGHSPSTTREALRDEHLAAIAEDPAAFLAHQDDPAAKGPPVTLADGSQRARIPGVVRWMWDGGFAGGIGLRWQPGTPDLPPWVYGHIGYSVVPWRRGRGYATRALALILPEARARGLPWVDITTDEDNLPSQRVVLANGGRPLGPAPKPEGAGDGEHLLFRIALSGG